MINNRRSTLHLPQNLVNIPILCFLDSPKMVNPFIELPRFPTVILQVKVYHFKLSMLLPELLVLNTVAGVVCNFFSKFSNLAFVLSFCYLEISIVLFLDLFYTCCVAALLDYTIFLCYFPFVECLDIFKLLLPICQISICFI